MLPAALLVPTDIYLLTAQNSSHCPALCSCLSRGGSEWTQTTRFVLRHLGRVQRGTCAALTPAVLSVLVLVLLFRSALVDSSVCKALKCWQVNS